MRWNSPCPLSFVSPALWLPSPFFLGASPLLFQIQPSGNCISRHRPDCNPLCRHRAQAKARNGKVPSPRGKVPSPRGKLLRPLRRTGLLVVESLIARRRRRHHHHHQPLRRIPGGQRCKLQPLPAAVDDWTRPDDTPSSATIRCGSSP
jgi:hypothetical protein